VARGDTGVGGTEVEILCAVVAVDVDVVAAGDLDGFLREDEPGHTP